jgi:glutathionyl-hydroquinone reductase
MKIPLRVTCKQVASLLIAREDREIALSEKVALRLHIYVCKACPNFEQQLLIMRKSLKLWRQYSVDGKDAS